MGPRARQRREHLGMKVAEVARLVGMAASTLYDFERGDIENITKLHRLASVLKTTPEALEGRPAAAPLPEDKPADLLVRQDLVEAIAMVDQFFAEARSTMSLHDKAELVSNVYDLARAGVERSKILQFVRRRLG